MKKISVQSCVTPKKLNYDLNDIRKNHPYVTIAFHPSSMTENQMDIFCAFLIEYDKAALNSHNACTPSGALCDTATMSRMPGAPPPPPTPVP